MVTTNNELILAEQIRLYTVGKIGTTGRKIAVKDSAGEIKILDEPEPIHTFQYWKACGFSVKKGEKAVSQFSIWKYAAGKKPQDGENDIDGENDGHCFMKLSSFFSFSQVEPTKTKEERK